MKYCQPTTTRSDSTMARMVFLCSLIQVLRSCRAVVRRWLVGAPANCGSCRGRCGAATSSLAGADCRVDIRRSAASRSLRSSSPKRRRQRGAPADQDVIVVRRSSAVRPCGRHEPHHLRASRRRTRLRSTALPTWRDTVKPIARRCPSPVVARRRACTTNAWPGARAPCAAARKSVRRFNRSMTCQTVACRSGPLDRSPLGQSLVRLSGAETGAAGDAGDMTRKRRAAAVRRSGASPTRAARREDLAAAFGRHPGAKAVPALAHQFARLIGPFHGKISAAHSALAR